MATLEQIDTWARAALDAKNAARERALNESRELVRLCANTIRAVHRGELEKSDSMLDSARKLSRSLTENLEDHPDLYYAGYVQDAQKEFVEATATSAVIFGRPLPDPEGLGVPPAPFLNALGECVGELRRYILDQLRQGKLARAEEILQTMDDVYGVMVSMDYPDALTGGLRRTTDTTRAIMERTRGDLTFALRQDQLERTLREVEQRIDTRTAPHPPPSPK